MEIVKRYSISLGEYPTEKEAIAVIDEYVGNYLLRFVDKMMGMNCYTKRDSIALVELFIKELPNFEHLARKVKEKELVKDSEDDCCDCNHWHYGSCN